MWTALLLAACSRAPAPAPAASDVAAPDAAPAAPPPEAPAPEPARAPANRPPQIRSVTLEPTAPTRADPIRAMVDATDPEGAPLDLDFEWTVNGNRVVDVASDRLGTGRFVKGDRVRVKVTASDGTAEISLESDELTIANTAPVFTTGTHDMKKVDGFTFAATDPDDDPLTWKLEGAPVGMAISNTGVLAYKGSESEPGGSYKVAVIVSDGQAWGRYEFPVTVNAGSGAKQAGK
jgi:hypothetical protein